MPRPGFSAALVAVLCVANPRGGGAQGAPVVPRARQPGEAPLPPTHVAPEEQPALAAMLRALADSLPADAAPACVVLRGGPPHYAYSPDTSLLARLGGARHAVVAGARCPPTYQAMRACVGPSCPVRPPGYVDPHEIDVMQYGLVGPDTAALVASTGQGTQGRGYQCGAHRRADGTWGARCKPGRWWIAGGPAPRTDA